jgi:hypothetical protein
LGIDLIWFGVLLGVNMQTSFMHPPFGFALFFLRSVAARVPYLDRVTGKKIEPITTGQIYWGAVPFVGIQLLMVALVIMFPGMVMHYKGNAAVVDPATIQIDIPGFGDQGGGMPSFELPGMEAPPSFGAPPAIPGQEGQPAQPAVPTAPDLTQPPSFN